MKRLLIFLLLTPALAFGQSLRSSSDSRTFTTAPTFPGAVSSGTIQTKGLVSTALTTPTNATFTATSGTLNDGTYYYRVTALDAAGETLASTETSLAVSAGAGANGVVVNWGTVVGATSYKVYGRSTGAELYMATVTAPNTTWTDTGAVTPSGALPVLGSSGNISTVSTVTARDLTTTAASGAVAFQLASGAKGCFGTGATGCVTSDGTLVSIGHARVKSITWQDASTPLVIKGGDNSDGSAQAIQFTNSYALTTSGDKVAVFSHNNGATDSVAIYADGSLWLAPHAVGTCGAATAPEGKEVTVSGATTHATKKCLCTYVPTGTTYAWKNISAIFATDAAAFGDTTTCPDP
jgi:hypothetical protein